MGCLSIVCAMQAEIRLPAFFSDNMVLQQQTQASFWGWADANQALKIKTSWNNATYKVQADENGAWKVKLETPVAGGPYSITLSAGKENLTLDNVLIGEVWFCSGQSNMEQPMKGYPAQSITNGTRDIMLSADDQLRLMTVKRKVSYTPMDDVVGTWAEAQPATVHDFSATAYYFGRFLRQTLDCPVGLVVSAWGGTCIEAWMDDASLANFKEVKMPTPETKMHSNIPTALYNGMVNPFFGMAMRGVIWYQGESNYDRAHTYADMMQAMVASWRQHWDIGEFPFYYCQIAPYDYSIITPKGQDPINSALLREAQMKAEDMIPNAAMVVLLDAGMLSGIHPSDKQTPGERLAMQALANTYGHSKVNVQSPRYESVEFQDSMAIVKFNRSPRGLDATLGAPTGFEIAGPDSVFYPAKAHIRWNTNLVEVSAPEVKKPVAVRYAFGNCVEASLFGQNGMPVSSFRTDF